MSQSEGDEACVVSVVFEHVRRPITVAEVHGGSMRLALRLSVGTHAIASIRGLRVVLRVAREDTTTLPAPVSRATLVLSTAMHAGVRCWGRLHEGTARPSARCRVWQEDCRIEASAPDVSS